MSHTTFRDEGLLVLDGVLTAPQFAALGREVTGGDYRFVHAQKWDKAWRLFDGQPLRGQSVYYDPQQRFGWKGACYPTSSVVDVLIDEVRRAAAAYPEIAGVEGRDWVALYLSPWLYPVGSAIAFHQDAGRYSGSFTFFAHPRWSWHWGGDLLVTRPRARAIQTSDDWLTDEAMDLADDPGMAVCVAPRPNRLALLREDRPHRITRVDANAGTHVRASVAGFFLRAP